MKPLIIPAKADPLHLKAYCQERFGQIIINNLLSQVSGHRVSLREEGQLSVYTGKLINLPLTKGKNSFVNSFKPIKIQLFAYFLYLMYVISNKKTVITIISV